MNLFYQQSDFFLYWFQSEIGWADNQRIIVQYIYTIKHFYNVLWTFNYTYYEILDKTLIIVILGAAVYFLVNTPVWLLGTFSSTAVRQLVGENISNVNMVSGDFHLSSDGSKPLINDCAAS